MSGGYGSESTGSATEGSFSESGGTESVSESSSTMEAGFSESTPEAGMTETLSPATEGNTEETTEDTIDAGEETALLGDPASETNQQEATPESQGEPADEDFELPEGKPEVDDAAPPVQQEVKVEGQEEAQTDANANTLESQGEPADDDFSLPEDKAEGDDAAPLALAGTNIEGQEEPSLPEPVEDVEENHEVLAENVALHGFNKHGQEFGASSIEEFKAIAMEHLEKPDDIADFSNKNRNARAYWRDDHQSILIHNETNPVQSTMFKPSDGKNYFDRHKIIS